MPPRRNKRQQRELEELEELNKNIAENEFDGDDEVEGEEQVEEQKRQTFATLMAAAAIDDGGEDESESEEEEERSAAKKKAKKKRKKPTEKKKFEPAASTTLKTPASASEPNTPDTKAKKAAKKARQKAKAEEGKGKGGDELEKALEELGISKPGSESATDEKNIESARSLSSLLSVSPPALNPDTELRRFFGSKVVGKSTTHTAAHRPTTHRGIQIRAPSSLSSGRGTIIQPKEGWPPGKLRDGLAARMVTKEEMPGWQSDVSTWWVIEADMKYRGFSRAFVETVHQGDPNPFYEILQVCPYHTDTLLQMGEMFSQREEHSTSSSMIERALYAYERAFALGRMNILSGTARLNFALIECRGFYLAVHRYIIDLLRRGCPSTAHAFSTLLLSLDPYSDPHGALLLLDYTAIKAGRAGAAWFESMYKIGGAGDECPNDTTWRWDCLPGWMYTRALARRMLEGGEGDGGDEDHSESIKLLVEAFTVYPELVPLIADKIDVSLSSKMAGRSEFKVVVDYSDAPNHQISTLHLLCHLYATRTAPLWKQASFLSLFKSALSSYTPFSSSITYPQRLTLLQSLASQERDQLSYNIYRHIFVASQTYPKAQAPGYKRLLKYMPRRVQEECGSSFSFDPLPPPSISSYELRGAYWDGVSNPFGGGGLGGWEEGGGGMRWVERIRRLLADNPQMVDELGGRELVERELRGMAQAGVGPEAVLEGWRAMDRERERREHERERERERERQEREQGRGDVDDDLERVHEMGLEAPIGVGGGEREGDGETEVESGSEEEEAPQPTFMQSILGRLWSFTGRGGGGGDNAQRPDEEEEEGQEHDGEVHREPAPDP